MSAVLRPSVKIRRTFLDFFASHGHEEVQSASIVPHNDPSLLFANAGMNQFKDVFTGKAKRDITRATTSQKCVRAGGKHNDLDNVGRTARHHTFFEMLGNFSFGDYFKEQAITFAHQLLIKEYGLDPKRLVYTVHHSDDEARVLWRKIAGISDDRIIGLGDKDNFWTMGETGPCGPCTEIHYYLGSKAPTTLPTSDEATWGGWVEIWNLVFMQFEQFADKTRKPLPRPSVDTGMGLERLCAVLGGFGSNYETDLLRPMIDEAAALSGKIFVPTDFSDNAPSVSLRAIADHARATAFLIADGVFPEKTGREYVLRRIMRRGIYHGWLLGIRENFLSRMADIVVSEMGDVYPELRERRKVILEMADLEERRFRETLERGIRMLEDESGRITGKTIPGDLAFKLYDTYGFPLDLTRVIGEGRGLNVDEAGFEARMDEQRHRGDFAGSGEAAVEAVFHKIAERVGASRFTGYDGTTGKAEIVALVASGAEVDTVPAGTRGPIALVVRETPFYAEQGGQVGDAGEARGPRGLLKVNDTRRPVGNLYVHSGELASGELKVGDTIELLVNQERRDAIRRNHSATHLLHWALHTVLGEHVAQKGSLVSADRLRFDFAHFQPLTAAERRQVEDLVNTRILRNVATETAVLPIAEAKRVGAVAFFGEKYGDTVRVLTIGESKEFCGGTHVGRSGDIGSFKILEETGIAQGVRRIEAVTGENAIAHLRRLETELQNAGDRLRVGPFEVNARIERLQVALKEKDQEIEKLRAKLASGGGKDLAGSATKIGSRWLLVSDVGVGDPKTLRDTVDKLREKLNPGLIVLCGAEGDKVALVCATTKDAGADLHAGKIVGELSQELGGKGGGRPDLGQGGGTRPADLEAVLTTWRDRLAARLGAA